MKDLTMSKWASTEERFKYVAGRLKKAEGILKEIKSMHDEGALCCDCVHGLDRKCGDCGVKWVMKRNKQFLEDE